MVDTVVLFGASAGQVGLPFSTNIKNNAIAFI
ncbi:hypothetical protein NITMOv2_2714 [Nitrospira moscoviensis]|uniref:Uncharacterized protein n=1 Tax=Nitrospira moscoviensis TaxID=42253 RepID=A0A0K2GDU0_NITMO|nr:hypothetical protein NITMOv2_2714 [Nitrospira moscoviensis]